MDLERIAVELRPREPWEAIDLGFAMTRRWWQPVFGAWLVVAAPIYAVVWLGLHRSPWLALLVLWWLRPLMDRVPLYVLSRALFGAVPTVREVATALPKILTPRLFDGLVVQRLDTMRTLHLPVSELEGGTGAARRKRRAVIRRAIGMHASWLSVSALLLYWTLLFGFVGFALTFTPDGPQWSAETLWSNTIDGTAPGWWLGVLVLCDFVAISVVEPFFVGAGFGLYINRRAGLEGWDVELAFRRLARRLAALGAKATSLLLLFALALAPAVSHATPTPAEVAEEVLEDPVFGEPIVEKQWKLREGGGDGAVDRFRAWLKDLLERLASWLEGRQAPTSEPQSLGEGVARILQGLAWLAVGLGLVGLAMALVHWYRRVEPTLPTRPSLPDLTRRSGELAGLELDPAETDAVVAAARALVGEGRHVEALALLYRAAVARLVARGLPLDDGATEGECLRVVRYDTTLGLSKESVDFFRQLTRSWQAVAYAHRPPDVAQLSGLLDAWSGHFGERA